MENAELDLVAIATVYANENTSFIDSPDFNINSITITNSLAPASPLMSIGEGDDDLSLVLPTVLPFNVSILRFSDSCYTLAFETLNKAVVAGTDLSSSNSVNSCNNNYSNNYGISRSSHTIVRYVEIEDVSILGNDIVVNRSPLLNNSKAQRAQYYFSFRDPIECSIFTLAFNNCISVRNMTLTVMAMVRDVYFSGIYSNSQLRDAPELPHFDFSVMQDDKFFLPTGKSAESKPTPKPSRNSLSSAMSKKCAIEGNYRTLRIIYRTLRINYRTLRILLTILGRCQQDNVCFIRIVYNQNNVYYYLIYFSKLNQTTPYNR